MGGVVLIVLDTHAWIWWAADSNRLSVRARRAIEGAQAIGICPISCWEVGMLVAKGRLALDRDVLTWLKQSLALPKAALVPISAEIAFRASSLRDEIAGDPADCLIAATALDARAGLITKDRRMRGVQGLKTTW